MGEARAMPRDFQHPSVAIATRESLRHDRRLPVRRSRRPIRRRAIMRAIKFGWEWLACAGGLVIASPLFLICWFVIRRDGGPMLYAHERVGRHGRPFKCLKFRTMVVDADRRLQELLASDPDAAAEWAAYQKLRNDPRVTPFGRFLRRTRLDEIPQFINVLRGEMALIGPRPVTAEELARYGRLRRLYKSVRPGITGLWQVSGGNSISYDERVALETHYIRDWSLGLDIIIVGRTIREVLFHHTGV